MTYAFDTKHLPWAQERKTLMSQTAKCSDLIANLNVRVRRDGSDTVENVRLDPLPLEQRWEGMTFKAEQPGALRHTVNSCCDEDTCLDRCLQFPHGERWMLEILAAQWAVERVDEVYRVEGEAYTFDTQTIRQDPGVWPVMRVPCLYCPLKGCITNCSNGEYSTGLANIVVSPPLSLLCTPPRDTPVPTERHADPAGGVQALSPGDLEHLQGQAGLQVDHTSKRGQEHGPGHPALTRRTRFAWIRCGFWYSPADRPFPRSWDLLPVLRGEQVQDMRRALRRHRAERLHRHDPRVLMSRFSCSSCFPAAMR